VQGATKNDEATPCSLVVGFNLALALWSFCNHCLAVRQKNRNEIKRILQN